MNIGLSRTVQNQLILDNFLTSHCIVPRNSIPEQITVYERNSAKITAERRERRKVKSESA